ncbi:MAG: sigma 54-interacting transcriptional regulator [Vicinamibacteria bacterium]
MKSHQPGRTALAETIEGRARVRWPDASRTVIIGLDAAFTGALERVARIAEADSSILLTGETGTGKELFARALYLLSRRDGQPFLSVNCAQYQDAQTIASELFGHRKGSFTGAAADHVGLFEAAHRGMVFLDEVAELSLATQAMLLRVLSEGELVPVGDTRPRRVDVRVVAATSVDLHEMVQQGRFRRDLFFRLRALQVRVPAVRERGDDWELIREYYLGLLGVARRRTKRFSRESISLLARYDWPGNVRELKGLVDTGFHLSDGDVIEPQHFVESLEAAARLQQIGRVPFVDVVSERYERLTRGEGDFWSLVHHPYLERDLSRAEVRALVERGLSASQGSYKKLIRLWSMEEGDYLRFMDFLRHQRLKPHR